MIEIDVPARLDELRLLKAGWLEGGGKALDPIALDKLTSLFTAFYPDGLPLPYAFPTESGGVQFEWRFTNSAPEIEIELATLRGEWLSDSEETIDLASSRGWAHLARLVSELAEPNPNRGSA